MRAWIRRAWSHEVVRASVGGLAAGLTIAAIALAWRSTRPETIVLEVAPASDPATIRVWVGGEVARPGLYTLARGSRVADALDAAGGISAAADTTALGMAAILEDADQLIVPSRAAAAPNPAPPEQGTSPGTPVAGGPALVATGRVNLNTATIAELETLPGIGPKLAERIVAYRAANGPFQHVDELEEVAGISERMVDELRPLVSVGP